MSRHSAGLLLYRRAQGLEVLLAHPGGPFWVRRDAGAWTLPKGEIEPGEEPLQAACREFSEETGGSARGPFLPLGEVRLKSGKRVQAWACEGDFDPAALRSIHFELEWPAGSGRVRSYPEVDRVGWFALPQARRRLLAAQLPFLERLADALGA